MGRSRIHSCSTGLVLSPGWCQRPSRVRYKAFTRCHIFRNMWHKPAEGEVPCNSQRQDIWFGRLEEAPWPILLQSAVRSLHQTGIWTDPIHRCPKSLVKFSFSQPNSLKRSKSVPDDIRQNLINRYEYVAAEKEVIPDLTDNVRLCQTCGEWCPRQVMNMIHGRLTVNGANSADSVKCDRCIQYFHMRCVQPPLAAKPSRGYGWTCAPCFKDHEEKVQGHELRHNTPSPTKPRSNAPALRGRGRPRKDRSQAEREENLQIKHFRMWPFRYFGYGRTFLLNCVAQRKVDNTPTHTTLWVSWNVSSIVYYFILWIQMRKISSFPEHRCGWDPNFSRGSQSSIVLLLVTVLSYLSLLITLINATRWGTRWRQYHRSV
jgi:hypothetical protein